MRDSFLDRQKHSLSLTIGCCVLLGIAEYCLYHVNFHQFFQGDAIFWMYYRFHTIGEFLRAFVTLDVAHWYRPLSNRTIPSLFYPFFGLHPYGYHLVFFTCFFIVSSFVLLFFRKLTGNLAVAFFGAFYFSIHSIDIYTTYDFAFAPEIFYAFFYIASVWLFLEAELRESSPYRAGSVACCALSLMSKEAAVTLPAMLVVAHMVFVNTGFVRALRAIRIHVVLWIAYLVYVVGYLGVGGGDYMLVVHTNVVQNLVTGIYYAFNLHRDGLMPTRAAPPLVLIFLVSFAALELLLTAWLLFGRERRLVLFGILWFAGALTPMLMLNGLGPYYVFLAMAGCSLIVGVSLNCIHNALLRYSRWGAHLLIGVFLAMFWISCQSVIRRDTAGDIALGYASKWAANSMTDMLVARPRVPHGSRIYIFDDSVPDLWRFHGIGSLFKLVYNDDSITTAFRSLGQNAKVENGELVVMKAEAEHLADVTAEFNENPGKFWGGIGESQIHDVDRPGVVLSAEPSEVIAGKDFFWLGIAGLRTDDVLVQYTIDDGPVAQERFRLNREGKVRFFVSEVTQVGLYRFVRFRTFASTGTEWTKANATLRVLPPIR